MTPRATYRIQFTRDFGFDDAARLAPYLAKLGVSHLYASPYLKARPGSTHGYDIVDHNALNPELGEAAAFARMHSALAARGLKQILDFVPNHMGVGGADNPFWLDVLEWGPASPFAGWFDIDWSPDRADLHDKVLVPFLGDQLGAAIEDGKLELRFDPEAGSFAVWAYDAHKLPIAPADYGAILGGRPASLERLGDAFASIGQWRPNERERAAEIKADLVRLVEARPEAMQAVAQSVARYRGEAGNAASWEPLSRLIARQHWRPAYFRVAADDINYRRFFNIAELAGLRMELPNVFDHAHRRVFELMAQGVVDGLRIDHIDGLLDPKGYLERLREKAPHPPDAEPFYLVVEKILANGEPLRSDWPVQGTTGYEVTNLLLGLLIEPAGEADFTRIYADFTRQSDLFERVLRRSKKQIMDNEMASELASLARSASRVARGNARTADFTRNILRRAIREVVASFPVYRTYVDFDGRATEADRAIIGQAVATAAAHDSAVDPSAYAFLQSLLSGEAVAEPNSGFSRSAVLRFAMQVQQYSGPVMAKGLEDTTFYRFNRFIALNEVGGDPRRFGLPVADFHAANVIRAERWPHAMLGTSTHDTKRGEDARARLAVLSEMPDAWTEAVAIWSRCLRGETASIGPEAAPDRNDEYALYQTLVGTVPPALLVRVNSRFAERSPPPLAGEGGSRRRRETDEGSASIGSVLRDPSSAPSGHLLPQGEKVVDPEGWSDYAARVTAAMQKAMREAKVHTTWASPNEAYENAMAALVAAALTGERAEAFRAVFVPFAARIARLGMENSLVQLALKLTMPGMPDLYQGTELWDLSMVDPDNRRPVDFVQREQMLDGLLPALRADRLDCVERLFQGWADGRIKLLLTATLLDLRRGKPDLFAHGDYEPLTLPDPDADAVCAFARQHGDDRLVVVAGLRPFRRSQRALADATCIELPPDGAAWRDVLSGRDVPDDPTLASLLDPLPVAVLLSSPD